MKAMGRALLFISWAALLAGVALGLPTVGMDVPPVTDLSAWGEWFGERPAVEGAFGVIQVVVWGASWYLIGVTTIGAVARLLRLGKLVRAVDVITVPMVRRLLQASFGLGLVAASFTGMSNDAPVDEQVHIAQPTHATAVLDQQMQRAGEMESMRLSGSDSLMLRYLGADDAQAAELRLEIEEREAELAAQEAAAGGGDGDGESGDRMWEVQPGEHFWGIAEQVLTDAWDRGPSDAELVPYWQDLIEVNRDELPDKGNPDLIFPGQKFVVPDPPPAP